ncbi:hypothetical protein VTK73DRAFT_3617 [Phialemonium thermophilum]|uniref:Glucose-methanol-choline oxidoreductase N-terminal domain-containing protein n=1 Tax=Phialemonium thermophilum TaxID=223376 RepID=A0ABR3VJA7_9PEZI
MPCCWILPTLSLLAALPGSLAHARGVHRARVVRDAGDIGAAYDYIVVGGGTAGLTVADRLTEDPATTVLVVENGILDDSASILRVQGGSGGLNPRFLYDITSVPQPHLRNRSAPVLAGNVVGGSSAVNGMMCVRGTAEDYDRWGRFFDGDDGDDVASRDNSSSSLSSDWSWHGMLPYFRKALRFVPPRVDVARSANISYDARFWGADGTSGVFAGWPSFQYADTALFYNAYAQIPGAQFPIDSGAGQAGVFWYPTFMDPASVTRSYARTGHYDRQQNRSNYHLVTGSRVDRVLLNGTTAVGVHVVAAARRDANTNTTTPRQVLARREVILAAGAIHTPQVLQLSGIGPAQLLAAANITPVVDLPGVGQNFQDHPSLAISIACECK